MAFGGKTYEELKAMSPRYTWDDAYREKLFAKVRSLPKETRMAMMRAQMEQTDKKMRALVDKYKFSNKVSSSHVNCRCFPNTSPPLTDSEYHEILQCGSYKAFAELAIDHYNKENNSEFKVVTVESCYVDQGDIWNQHVIIKAKDAKDPSAAILTFQADVTLKEGKQNVVFCKRI